MINIYVKHLTYDNIDKVNSTPCPWPGQLVSTLTGMDEQISGVKDKETIPWQSNVYYVLYWTIEVGASLVFKIDSTSYRTGSY